MQGQNADLGSVICTGGVLHALWYHTEVCSPVQVELQVREDEFLLNELPDDSGHLVSLHLHHRAGLDLLRHL